MSASSTTPARFKDRAGGYATRMSDEMADLGVSEDVDEEQLDEDEPVERLQEEQDPDQNEP